MSLSFIGKHGGFERRWIVYALLRDNVQHHLESGTPGEQFSTLHAISKALGAGGAGVELPADKLRDELAQVTQKLASVPVADLAISLRTRAVTTHLYPLPETRGTELVRDIDWTPPFATDDVDTLGQLFEPFISEILQAIGDDAGVLRVIDS